MIKPEIILVGGGGHCKSCIDVIEAENKFKVLGIVDLKDRVDQTVLGYKICWTDNDLEGLSKDYNHFLITLGQIITPKHLTN